MKMEFDKIRDEVDKLNLSQRIMLAQEIWDSIARHNETLPMPEWQKRELDKRYTQFKEGEYSEHNWREIHAALRAKSV